MNEIDVTSGQKARVTKLLNETKDSFNVLKEEIQNFKKLLLEDDGSRKSIKTEIDETYSKILEQAQNVSVKADEVLDFHSSVFSPDEEGAPSIKEDIETVQSELIELLEETKTKKNEFDSFYIKIFGFEKDGKKVIGLKQEIDERKKELNDLKEEKTKEYNALFEKIEGLLPGATSIGLAKAYQEQKNQYYWPNIGWSFIFIATMVGMIIYSIMTLKESVDFIDATSRTLAKVPFLVPAIWLGIFASKQQSQNKRLAQEYAFKETLARSYEGYKKQIDNLGQSKEAKEVLIALAKNLVVMAGENPSITLDSKMHKEDPPIINKLLGLISRDKDAGKEES